MKVKVKCLRCEGIGTYLKDTEIENRCYSSTSSGELNGPYSVKCEECNGTGKRTVERED